MCETHRHSGATQEATMPRGYRNRGGAALQAPRTDAEEDFELALGAAELPSRSTIAVEEPVRAKDSTPAPAARAVTQAPVVQPVALPAAKSVAAPAPQVVQSKPQPAQTRPAAAPINPPALQQASAPRTVFRSSPGAATQANEQTVQGILSKALAEQFKYQQGGKDARKAWQAEVLRNLHQAILKAPLKPQDLEGDRKASTIKLMYGKLVEMGHNKEQMPFFLRAA